MIKSIHRRDVLDCFHSNEIGNIPSVILTKADNNRKDAKEIRINGEIYSNSGFIVVSSIWIEDICAKNKIVDIDTHIFTKDKYRAIIVDCEMVDIGTPQRLHDYRRMIK